MKYSYLVIGPAGCGKSTFCKNIQEHYHSIGQDLFMINFDPAAEDIIYNVDLDVRDFISVDDAQLASDLRLGPNGGLLFCIDYLTNNLDWFDDNIGDVDDDLVVIDCPGQIELYIHMDAINKFILHLKRKNFNICAIYCLDCQYLSETAKYISGILTSLSSMVLLELPHVNVMTKIDLLSEKQKEQLEYYLDCDPQTLASESSAHFPSEFKKMNSLIANLIENFSLVHFNKLDYSEEESLENLLIVINNSIQFGEDKIYNHKDFEDQIKFFIIKFKV